MFARSLLWAVEHLLAGTQAYRSADQVAAQTSRRGGLLLHSNVEFRGPRLESAARSETKTAGTAGTELLPRISQTLSAASGADSLARNSQTVADTRRVHARSNQVCPNDGKYERLYQRLPRLLLKLSGPKGCARVRTTQAALFLAVVQLSTLPASRK